MRPEILAQLQEERAAKHPVALATKLVGGDQILVRLSDTEIPAGWPPSLLEATRAALAGDRAATVESPDGPVFLNVFNPPLRLIAVGAVHITQALAPMAAMAGYEVTVIDPRRSFATQDRFPGITLNGEWPDEAMAALKPDTRTAIVTLTHDPKLDDPALDAGLRSGAFYIGALGSRKTHASRLDRLGKRGFDAQSMTRIHGPVGLSIGAKSPSEIAVSILAQITQCLRQEPV